MTEPKKFEEFTKYEKTRIIGARALQVAMDAPILKEFKKGELEEMNYDSIKIAEEEFSSNVLPITIVQPMPKKKTVKIKKTTNEENEVKDKEVAEKEIEEEGEIMEMANPEDEEETSGGEFGGREGNEELQ